MRGSSEILKNAIITKRIKTGIAKTNPSALDPSPTALKTKSDMAIHNAKIKSCITETVIGHILKFILAKIPFLICLGKSIFIALITNKHYKYTDN